MHDRHQQLTLKLTCAGQQLACAEAELKTIQPLQPPFNSDGVRRLGDLLLPTAWPDLFLDIDGFLVPHKHSANGGAAEPQRKRREKTMIGGLRRITAAPNTTLVYRGMMPRFMMYFVAEYQVIFLEHPVFEPETAAAHNTNEPIDRIWTNYDHVAHTGLNTAMIGLKNKFIGDGSFRLALMICGPTKATALAFWQEIAARIRGSLPYEAAAQRVETARKQRDAAERKLAKSVEEPAR